MAQVNAPGEHARQPDGTAHLLREAHGAQIDGPFRRTWGLGWHADRPAWGGERGLSRSMRVAATVRVDKLAPGTLDLRVRRRSARSEHGPLSSASVDTNVLVRHLTGDPVDLAARATAHLGSAQGLLLTDLVAAERTYWSRSTKRLGTTSPPRCGRSWRSTRSAARSRPCSCGRSSGSSHHRSDHQGAERSLDKPASTIAGSRLSLEVAQIGSSGARVSAPASLATAARPAMPSADEVAPWHRVSP